MPVLQSGTVTPGHAATWVTDGVIADSGPFAASQKVLAKLLSANFNATSDQPILIPSSINAFQLTGIIVTNASTSLSLAVGDFYSAPFKGGSALTGPGQSYSALVTPNNLLNATLTSFANTTRFSINNLSLTGALLTIFLSLTTPQGIPATADVYLLGIDLT